MIAEIRFPLPDIDLIEIYKPLKEENGSRIYPVRINVTFCNVRKNKDVMWLKTEVSDIFSNEVWNLVGNMIDDPKCFAKKKI